MKTQVILEAIAKQGKKSELLNFLQEIIPDTRAFKGCNEIYVFEEGFTNNLTLISNWETKHCYESYFEWRTQTGVIKQLSQLLIGPPDIKFLNHKF